MTNYFNRHRSTSRNSQRTTPAAILPIQILSSPNDGLVKMNDLLMMSYLFGIRSHLGQEIA